MEYSFGEYLLGFLILIGIPLVMSVVAYGVLVMTDKGCPAVRGVAIRIWKSRWGGS